MEDDIEIVAEVGTGDVIVPTALRTRPDVAVIDIELPGMDGLSAAAELHERLPECRALILTGVGRCPRTRRGSWSRTPCRKS
ncbi:response regulator [Streptosporangium amethystogenes]|uniref:response regulator n=1 Tax=Streptosporangium amethystogenes TaxID=2002 RepID=UPI000691099B